MTDNVYTQPMGVLEAERTRREIELWREHELVANALRDVQRRAHSGRSTPGDDVLHKNLVAQLELIETAMAVMDAEDRERVDARVATLVQSFQAEIAARVAARDVERTTAAVMSHIHAISPKVA